MHRTKIFGPPGTGKTRALLEIMDRELEAGVQPERLAYLTFTVQARQVAKERATTKFGFSPSQLKWFRTLHSVAYELLGVNQEALVTPDQGLADFGELYGYEFSRSLRWSDEGLPSFGFGKADRLMAFDHFRRNRLETWEQAYKRWPEHDIKKFEVQRFCEGYQKWKGDDGWVDFTDLLERGSAPLPCDVVIVDEAQDLSPLQWQAFWKFAETAQRVYIGGDDDQAIYEWAGASPAVFLAQPADVVQVLPQSWRCPRRVTERAQRLISRVKVRQPKSWRPREVDGVVAKTGYVDQAEIPDTGSVLFLYRNHKYADEIAQHLKREGLTYQLGRTSSVKPEVAAAILGWEDLRKGKPVEWDSVEAVFAYASLRRISQDWRDRARARKPQGTVTRSFFVDWTAKVFDLPWYDLLDRLVEDEFYLRKVIQRGGRAALLTVPRITLNTIHGVKGGEADHVILHTEMSKLVKKGMEVDEDAERRVWYVGLTRTRETLTLVGLDNPLL